MSRQVTDCPFCEGDIDGCCFCDHTGKVYVGEGEFFKTVEQTESIGVQFLKDQDKRSSGDIEMWPEMIEYFMNENNVPNYFKNQPQ